MFVLGKVKGASRMSKCLSGNQNSSIHVFEFQMRAECTKWFSGMIQVENPHLYFWMCLM